MSEYTFETAALKAVTIDAVKYNEEGLKNSMPMAWDDSNVLFGEGSTTDNKEGVILGASATGSYQTVVVGQGATAGWYSTVIGQGAYSGYAYNVVMGQGASSNTNANGCVVIGQDAKITSTAIQTKDVVLIGRTTRTAHPVTITLGSAFSDTAGSYTCTTQGTGSITIGAGANTLNNGNIESSNSVTIGCKANTIAPDSITLGAGASNTNSGSILIGSAAKSEGDKALTITLGSQFTETTDAGDVTHTCSTEGTGSITIGAGANTVNTTKTVDGVETTVESSNSVTIGCKAKNQCADSVVIGAQARVTAAGAVVMGAGAKSLGSVKSVSIGQGATCESYECSIALGTGAKTKATSNIAIGQSATTNGSYANAFGCGSNSLAKLATAVGYNAKTADIGCVVFASWSNIAGTKTQLYFSGADTPLANEYEDGEAMMGYVVTDKAGNVMMDAEGNALVGTQKLSVLFPNNRGENAFTPAALNLDEGWTPKPMFLPSDLNLPIEEPEVEEPENVEPANPLVYKPQPVYPIVEPEIEDINE